ncbi:MAG: efflux RND transporter permease subunit [Desulfosudaceae bacterium]
MRRFKQTIEKFFEDCARLLYRHCFLTLLGVLVVLGGVMSQVPDIRFDTSSESLLRDNDPCRLQYDQFREEFGQDRNIVLGITAPDIFSYDFLIKLQSLHQDLARKVPHVKRVNSLLTARHISGLDDMLEVGELLEGWPAIPVDMGDLRRRVMRDPYYRNYLISEDGTMTAISLETEAVIHESPASQDDILAEFTDTPAESSTKSSAGSADEKRRYISSEDIRQIVRAVNNIIPRYEDREFSIAFSGSPVVVDVFNRAVATDMVRCSLLAIIAIAVFLGLLFRRISGVVLPLLVVVASVFSALGVMALGGVDIKIMTAILPVFILCVGVADAVHVLTIFFRRYRLSSQTATVPSKEEALVRAMGHSGLAILLTSLTTAAGLLSFGFAEVAAIGEMGVFSAVGVIIAFFYTLVMLPPLVAILPLKPGRALDRQTVAADRILAWFADLAAAHAVKIVVIAVILLVVSLAGLSRIKYRDHMLNYFPENMAVKQDITIIEEKLGGVLTFEAIVDTGRENGLHDPVILNNIDTAARRLKKDLKNVDPRFEIKKIFTINDIVKQINQALNNDEPAAYRIPDNRRLIAQELLLFENSGAEDLEPIVDNRFSKTRLSIKVPWLDSLGLYHMSRMISGLLHDVFAGRAEVSLTGMSVILARTLPATLNSMYESYLLAGIVISLLMIFLMGDLKTGLLSMFPNLLPILMVMGALGALGVPLDMTSLMIGSIAIGLVVDDTMHFMYNFRRYYDQTGDAREAVRRTLTGTGRALMITSLVLSGGFFMLLAATLPHLSRFGLLLSIIIIVAVLTDFILAPALMILATAQESRQRSRAAPPVAGGAGLAGRYQRRECFLKISGEKPEAYK